MTAIPRILPRETSGLKTLAFTALAIIAAGLGLAAYRHQAPRPVADHGAGWEPIGYGASTGSVSATGVLQPRDAVAVGTEQAGRVIEVLADLHQSVEKDQPLLRLDAKFAKLRQRQAEVAVAL